MIFFQPTQKTDECLQKINKCKDQLEKLFEEYKAHYHSKSDRFRLSEIGDEYKDKLDRLEVAFEHVYDASIIFEEVFEKI